MKFISWSLNEPSNTQFAEYATEVSPGEWQILNPDAWKNWGGNQKNFWIAFMNHHDKIYGFGLHDFGVNADGTIYSYKAGEGYPVLNEDETAIRWWMRDSLRFLVDHYPDIKWSLQMVCFGPSRVEPILDNVNGAQDTFVRQLKKIAELYLNRFPGRIKGIEMDFEKYTSRPRSAQEPEKYRDLLRRVKDEVCRPLGLEIRVNLHAMTGEYEPSWYAWTNYSTIAEADLDEYQIMSYDFSAGDTAPGPSTPVWWLLQVLDHVKNVLPTDRTFIGNAAYGRRWSLNRDRLGTAIAYWQLLYWQNGLFKHNAGERNDQGEFIWFDQSFIPYCGFHDEESGYEYTFLHCYDRFQARFARLLPYNNSQVVYRGTYRNAEYITSYSKHQRAKFTGIQRVLTEATSTSGHISDAHSVWEPKDDLPGYTFYGYNTLPGQYLYDEATNSCVRASGAIGQDGRVTYSFSLSTPGTYRLVAAVYFPYLNCRIPINVNGVDYVIGEDVPDWYPFFVNPSHHFFDCGTFSFGTSNTITVGVTQDSAQIMGFVICRDFEHGMSGGEVEYNVNLQVPKKRGSVVDGVVTKVDADMPDEVTLTAELIRRHPRPAIVWEDLFGPFAEQEVKNLTETNYYQRAITGFRAPNGPYPVDGACRGPLQNIGYSNGTWRPVAASGNDDAHVYCDARSQSAQLVLNREFSFNAHIEADLRALDSNAIYGIRFYARNPGTVGNGYIAQLNYRNRTVRLVYESGGSSQVLATAPMSETLANGLGNRHTLTVRVYNGRIKILVGAVEYINYSGSLPGSLSRGAHGVYANGTRIRCYRLHIATNDRYEPMEKVSAIVDGREYVALEEDRPYSYDELGYLVYSGFNPDEGLGIRIDNDYNNFPIVNVPSWVGEKTVRIRLVDAGVWLRNFYIGDGEEYSIAWNSDLEGFITTLGFIKNYGCKGVGMWTIGQEDPRVFTYLPPPND